MSKKVEFLVIGAGKSGTTWIWDVLRKHPDCFVPNAKELHYFNVDPPEPVGRENPNFRKGDDWYHRHFANASSHQVIGEISPSYLWSKGAAEAIYQYNPNIKLIALLRDPVDRAYSQFRYRIQRGIAPQNSFEEEIKKSPFIIERSMYGKLLTPYFTLFPRNQIKILFFEDIQHNSELLVAEVQEFLGIPHLAIPASKKINATGRSRFPRLNRAIGKIDLWSRRLAVKDVLRVFIIKFGFKEIIDRVRSSKVAGEPNKALSRDVHLSLLRNAFSEDTRTLKALISLQLPWETDVFSDSK
jgi:hypothetical protein